MYQLPDMDEFSEVVAITQGLVQGRKSHTKNGKPLVSFQGIPYAKPPIGVLRFKPPQCPDSWDGVYQADKEGNICPQFDNGMFIGDEDCLYLNVYTQEIKLDVLKPVMVWIHGGGFVKGSGNTDIYGPDYLVDAGVVLVTFNYRIGVLGFLSLDNADASGNMGLKDQVAVLHWVHQNIAAFGGDPANVTIFGESAGAVSVNFHLLSPMTKGLFHKAIAQSGSALNPYGFTREGRMRSFRLGELLGLKTNNEKELFDFLCEADIEKLIKMSGKVLSRLENTSGLKIVFVPTKEPVVPGQTPYLTEFPITLMKNAQFHNVPYITGTVTHEGMIMLRALFKNGSVLDEFNKKFELVIPSFIRNGMSRHQIQELCEKIKLLYFKNAPLSQDNILSYVDLNTDAHIAAGTYAAAKLLAAGSAAPVYYYNFDFDGELGCSKQAMGPKASIVRGPIHGDDLGYLFRLGLFDPDLDPDSSTVQARSRMVTLWTNFAKTGNPTHSRTSLVPIQWSPFTVKEEKYLDFGEDLSIKSYLWKERMALWEQAHTSKL